MATHIHSDASYCPEKHISRGSYVILHKRRKTAKSGKAKLIRRHIKRTPIMKGTHIADAEMLTAMQALIHAMKLYPEESKFYIYSDSMYVIDHFKMKWYDMVINPRVNKYFERMVGYLRDNPRDKKPHFYASHVKAHDGKSTTEETKMNIICDFLASVKNV